MHMKLKNQLNKVLNNKNYRDLIRILRDSCWVLLVIYLLLLLVDTIWERSISSYLNVNILMIVVIIFAIIVILTQPEIKEEAEHGKADKKSTIFCVCIGIGGGIIIWYKTNEIGWLSYLVSITGGSMITLISLMILSGNGLKNEKTRMDITNDEKVKSGVHPELESREKSQFPH